METGHTQNKVSIPLRNVLPNLVDDNILPRRRGAVGILPIFDAGGPWFDPRCRRPTNQGYKK